MPVKKKIKVAEEEMVVTTAVQKMRDAVSAYPLFIFCIVLAVLLVLMTVLYFTKGTVAPVVLVPDDIALLPAEEQAVVNDNVLEALAQVMILPDDAEPVIATVTDAETLRGQQAFYAKVQDDDILVVFQTSRQAVIYRPSVQKIVNAGSLIIDNQ